MWSVFMSNCWAFFWLLPAWRWKQRAKAWRSSSSITRNSWQPCCLRTPSIRSTAPSRLSQRKRWRMRTMPWSFWVISHPQCIPYLLTRRLILCCGAVMFLQAGTWSLFNVGDTHTHTHKHFLISQTLKTSCRVKLACVWCDCVQRRAKKAD